MGKRLEGKIAIISGAGSQGPGWGNGKATAVVFAREGAKVVAVDMNLEAAEETRSLIAEEGGECIAVKADVSDEEQVRALVNASLDRYGRVDVLHNNVGIVSLGGICDLSPEEWDRVFRVNVKSIYLTTRFVLPIMERQGSGSIINISSIGSIRDVSALYAAYGASKAAINQITRGIAVQYAARGIRCNAILPGLMNTPLIHTGISETYGSVDEMVAARDQRCPTGKMGTGWDTAYAALFLASDESRYVNGIELVVDGGLTATVP